MSIKDDVVLVKQLEELHDATKGTFTSRVLMETISRIKFLLTSFYLDTDEYDNADQTDRAAIHPEGKDPISG